MDLELPPFRTDQVRKRLRYRYRRRDRGRGPRRLHQQPIGSHDDMDRRRMVTKPQAGTRRLEGHSGSRRRRDRSEGGRRCHRRIESRRASTRRRSFTHCHAPEHRRRRSRSFRHHLRRRRSPGQRRREGVRPRSERLHGGTSLFVRTRSSRRTRRGSRAGDVASRHRPNACPLRGHLDR